MLQVEFYRSLSGENLYNNSLQPHSRDFFTLKGIKLNFRSYHTVILVVCAAMVIGSRVIDADQLGVRLFGFKWPMHCLLNHTFGVKCALCGLTRSFCATARGDFSSALRYHRLGPVLFGFIIFQIPYRVWAVAISPRRINVKIRKAHTGLIAIVIIAIFINWLIYLGGRLL